jgi:hypothetical protein
VVQDWFTSPLSAYLQLTLFGNCCPGTFSTGIVSLYLTMQLLSVTAVVWFSSMVHMHTQAPEAVMNLNASGDTHVSFFARHLVPSPCGRFLLVSTDTGRMVRGWVACRW